MKIDFNELNSSVTENLFNGEGFVKREIFEDEATKIMRVEIKKGSSIGSHGHSINREIIYVIKGKATCIIDGVEEIVESGKCHYAPRAKEHIVKNNHDEDLVFFAVLPNL